MLTRGHGASEVVRLYTHARNLSAPFFKWYEEGHSTGDLWRAEEVYRQPGSRQIHSNMYELLFKHVNLDVL